MNGLFSSPWLSSDLRQNYLATGRLVAEYGDENKQREAALGLLNRNNCATSSPESPSGLGYGSVSTDGATGFANGNLGLHTTTTRIPNDWNFGNANAHVAGLSHNNNSSPAWFSPTTTVDTCSPMSTVARNLVHGYANSNWYALTKGLMQNHLSNNNTNSAAPVWNSTATISPLVQNCDAWQRPLGNLPVVGHEALPRAPLANLSPLSPLDPSPPSIMPLQPNPALWTTAAMAAVGAAATVELGTLQTAATTDGLRTSDKNVQSPTNAQATVLHASTTGACNIESPLSEKKMSGCVDLPAQLEEALPILAPGPDPALPRRSMDTGLKGRNSSSGTVAKQVAPSDMVSKKRKKSPHGEQTASQSPARSAKRACLKVAPSVNPTRRASLLLQCEKTKQRKSPLEPGTAVSGVDSRDCTKARCPEPPAEPATVSPESTVVCTKATRLGKEQLPRTAERDTELDRQSRDYRYSSSGKFWNKESRRDKVSRDDSKPHQNNVATRSEPHPAQRECKKSVHTGNQPSMDIVSSGVVDLGCTNIHQTIQQSPERPENRPVFHYSPLQSSHSESRAAPPLSRARNSLVVQTGSQSARDDGRKARSDKLSRRLRSETKRPASSVRNITEDPAKRTIQQAGKSSDCQQSLSQSRTEAKSAQSAQSANTNVITLRQQERQEFVRTDARHGYNAIQALAVDSRDFNRRIDDLCEAFVARGLHEDWDHYGSMLLREMERRIEASEAALTEAGSESDG
jgi:hypothetical protein